MTVTVGIVIACVACCVAAGFGLYRRRTDGRFREKEGEASTWTALAPAVDGLALGERATLVQFSSAFCSPCRTTRAVLGDVAATVPGVTHVDIDAEAHLDVVRELGILRTPTTLILDARGREITRAAGAPKRDQVLSALAASL